MIDMETDKKTEITADQMSRKKWAEERFGALAKSGEERGQVVHGRIVGRQNAEKVLIWVWQWGWTFEEPLQMLLNVKRRPSTGLVQRGILHKVPAPMGYKPAYVITQNKIVEAQVAYDNSIYDPLLNTFDRTKQPSQMHYPWPRTDVPFRTEGEHSRLAQIIALNELARRPGLLTTERELSAKAVNGRGGLPDFVISRPDATNGSVFTEWHEVELSGKKLGADISGQLFLRELARAQKRFSRIYWHCATLGVARNIKATLMQKQISQVIRAPSGKWVFDSTKPSWNPEKLLAVSKFLIIGGDRDKPREITVDDEMMQRQQQYEIPLDVDNPRNLEVVAGL